MLNNKGFAVSSVLYTLLIAFLLFLGAALAQFSASSSLIGKANDDLVNGSSFEAMQIKPNGACKDGNNGNSWYKDSDGNISNTVVRIKTRYGTKYWPKDFETLEHRKAELSDGGNINEGVYTNICLVCGSNMLNAHNHDCVCDNCGAHYTFLDDNHLWLRSFKSALAKRKYKKGK